MTQTSPEAAQPLQDIHERVAAYFEAHAPAAFDPANPKVRLHEPTFGADEINAVLDTMLTTWVTMGKRVIEFEKAYGRAFGFAHGVMNNSGSSANLLAAAALVIATGSSRK